MLSNQSLELDYDIELLIIVSSENNTLYVSEMKSKSESNGQMPFLILLKGLFCEERSCSLSVLVLRILFQFDFYLIKFSINWKPVNL